MNRRRPVGSGLHQSVQFAPECPVWNAFSIVRYKFDSYNLPTFVKFVVAAVVAAVVATVVDVAVAVVVAVDVTLTIFLAAAVEVVVTTGY